MPEGLPYLDIKELTIVFNYKNRHSTRAAISRGTFPVATYRMGGKRVADREVVKEYFRRMRDEGLNPERRGGDRRSANFRKQKSQPEPYTAPAAPSESPSESP